VALLSQKLCLLYSVSSAQWWNYSFPHSPTRHGEIVFQVINSFVAHSVDLSVWQEVQGLGTLYLFVIVGEMNLKVCELTKLRSGQNHCPASGSYARFRPRSA
jgi:hypothetical protein